LLSVCRQLFQNRATQGFGSIPMRNDRAIPWL
jgi:hypothetical protein